MKIKVTPGKVKNLLKSLGRVTVTDKILADDLTVDEISAIADLFEPWVPSENVALNDFRTYNGELYKCVQAHTTQTNWTPDITPALWTIKSAPGIVPEWVQPTGAQDAYNIDDLVTHNGKTWKSTIDANTTEPGTLIEHGYWVEV